MVYFTLMSEKQILFSKVMFSLVELAAALARTPSVHCSWSDWLVTHMLKHKAHTMQLCYKS